MGVLIALSISSTWFFTWFSFVLSVMVKVEV
nr:MAG TPA: hypothetical protein [Caudoviricetes sp.]